MSNSAQAIPSEGCLKATRYSWNPSSDSSTISPQSYRLFTCHYSDIIHFRYSMMEEKTVQDHVEMTGDQSSSEEELAPVVTPKTWVVVFVCTQQRRYRPELFANKIRSCPWVMDFLFGPYRCSRLCSLRSLLLWDLLKTTSGSYRVGLWQ